MLFLLIRNFWLYIPIRRLCHWWSIIISWTDNTIEMWPKLLWIILDLEKHIKRSSELHFLEPCSLERVIWRCAQTSPQMLRITWNCAVSIANNLDALRTLRAHQINWLSDRQATNKWSQSNHCHTSCGESQNTYQNRTEMHKMTKQSLAIKHFSEACSSFRNSIPL